MEHKVSERLGIPIYSNADKTIICFMRGEDGVLFCIDDVVKTSQFGVRMAGYIKSFTTEGLVTFRNALPNGNDVQRYINKISKVEPDLRSITLWINS